MPDLYRMERAMRDMADLLAVDFDAALIEAFTTLPAREVFGGEGSGNFGHAGRPGEVGGSAPGSGGDYESISSPDDLEMRSPGTLDTPDVMAYQKGLLPAPSEYPHMQFGTPPDEIKNEVITKLSESSGLSYKEANKFVKQWSETSNDHSYTSLEIQEIAADELNGGLSDWQKNRIKEIEGDPKYKTSGTLFMEESGYNHDLSRHRIRKAVRSTYDSTQKYLKENGVDYLTLYRGVSIEDDKVINKMKVGGTSLIKSNALESWTLKPAIAENFTSNPQGWRKGVVIKAKVPRSRVYSTARTGVGCLNEWEVVLIGNVPAVQDSAVIVGVYNE